METEAASAALPAGTAGAGGALGSSGVSEVIADVAHTLRNHFHRLYYWMDVVGERALDDDARAALDAAGVAVRSIERLTAGAMALSRDLDLSPISMEATEVADAIAQSLRRQGAEVALECGAAAGVRVAIDASHVSRTIEIIGSRLGATPDGSVAVELRAERDDGWVVFAMHARGTTDSAVGEVERMLEWAQAERVARHHHGRLLWEMAGPEEHRAVLLLPAAD